jgi:general secretion pathway protein G
LNHPERDAVGICVKCRKYVCAECATRITGVNYCADCLPRTEGKEKKRSQSWEKPAAALVTLVSLIVCSLIIGVFAVLFIPKASSNVSAEQWERNDEWLEKVVHAVLEFHKDCTRFPTEGEGLRALLDDCGSPGWDGPYLDTPRLNPWGEVADVYGSRLVYRLVGGRNPAIISAGQDRVFQTAIDALSEGEGESGDDSVLWVR